MTVMIAATTSRPGTDWVMTTVQQCLYRLLREEAGQDLIEYALVFSLVALGAVASMKSLSTSIVGVFSAIGTTLTSAT